MLSENPKSGKVEAEPVLAVRHDPVSPLLAVALSDGSSLEVTADHPFWVDWGADLEGAGWLAAGQLRVGDQLRSASGRAVTVVGLRYEVGEAYVYTLTVAQDHTFFVGVARVLVHNSEACERVYDPRPAEPGQKHGPGGRGSTMDLSPEAAQQLLSEGIEAPGKKQVYGFYEGRFYEFQPDNAGTYHGYPIPGNELPSDVLDAFRNLGRITNAQFNKARKGKI